VSPQYIHRQVEPKRAVSNCGFRRNHLTAHRIQFSGREHRSGPACREKKRRRKKTDLEKRVSHVPPLILEQRFTHLFLIGYPQRNLETHARP
jgi:hypothetical protein